MSSPLTRRQIWGAPIALGALSALGLVTALLADGLGDIVSWIALAAPIAVALWYGAPRT